MHEIHQKILFVLKPILLIWFEVEVIRAIHSGQSIAFRQGT
jgi:hypothetical protein